MAELKSEPKAISPGSEMLGCLWRMNKHCDPGSRGLLWLGVGEQPFIPDLSSPSRSWCAANASSGALTLSHNGCGLVLSAPHLLQPQGPARPTPTLSRSKNSTRPFRPSSSTYLSSQTPVTRVLPARVPGPNKRAEPSFSAEIFAFFFFVNNTLTVCVSVLSSTLQPNAQVR